MTNFFCLSYALVNLSAFVLRITGAPNYRPRFKLCSWQVSLSGALLNFIIMFYIDWVFEPFIRLTASKALISVIVMVVIFIFLLYTTPRQEWGDISQSLIFHQVRKMLLKLDLDKNHPKYWRPSVLLYAPTPETFPLIDFCNVLKKGGLYVVGTVYQKDVTQESDEFYTLENFWSFFIGHVLPFYLFFLLAVQRQSLLHGELRALRGGRPAQHGLDVWIGCPSSQHHRDSARARTFLRRFVLRGDSASPQRHDGRRLAACFGGRTARKGVTGSHCRAS